MLPEKIHVEHHAHGDEKKAHENVAVGQNTRNDAHAVFGSGQQKSGHKRAQRQRKAQGVCQQGHAEAQPQGGEQQDFSGAGSHHRFHEAVKAEAREEQYAPQRQNHPQGGEKSVFQREVKGAGKQGHAQQHGSHHDVLKNQNGERQAARRRIGCAALLHDAQYNGRGRKRDQAAHKDALLIGIAAKKGKAHDGQNRKPYLQAAAQKDRPFQPVEGLARKLHAYGEQQHGHADFGHMVNGVTVADYAEQRRAAQNARKQKTHRGGQFDFVAGNGDEDREQKYGDYFIKQGHVHGASVAGK